MGLSKYQQGDRVSPIINRLNGDISSGEFRMNRLLERFFYAGSIILFGLGLASTAGAGTYTFNTADNQIIAGTNNQGWWSKNHENFNTEPNHYTGSDYYGEFRGFFTFDLAGFDLDPGETIVSAKLSLFTSDVLVLGGDFETLGFYHVSTNSIALNYNDGISTSIYNDLGSGDQYATQDYYGSDSDSIVDTMLNSIFLDHATLLQGDYISIGMAILSLSGHAFPDDGSGEGVFGYSKNINQVLTIETVSAVPLPAALPLFGTAMAIIGFIGWKRRSVKV